MFAGSTRTSGFSPALSRSLSTFVTANTNETLWPLLRSNSGVSLLNTCFGAPPLKMNRLAIEYLKFERFVSAGVEEFFHFQLARRQSLRVVMTQEGLERLAIGFHAV